MRVHSEVGVVCVCVRVVGQKMACLSELARHFVSWTALTVNETQWLTVIIIG